MWLPTAVYEKLCRNAASVDLRPQDYLEVLVLRDPTLSGRGLARKAADTALAAAHSAIEAAKAATRVAEVSGAELGWLRAQLEERERGSLRVDEDGVVVEAPFDFFNANG